MSLADRPFTESEVKFLRYIRQWGKKVVFVLNKVSCVTSQICSQRGPALIVDLKILNNLHRT